MVCHLVTSAFGQTIFQRLYKMSVFSFLNSEFCSNRLSLSRLQVDQNVFLMNICRAVSHSLSHLTTIVVKINFTLINTFSLRAPLKCVLPNNLHQENKTFIDLFSRSSHVTTIVFPQSKTDIARMPLQRTIGP